MEDIPEKLSDVLLFEGRATEYVEQYLEETGVLDQLPEHLRFYFDVRAYTRDLIYGGDIAEIEIDGRSFVAMAE